MNILRDITEYIKILQNLDILYLVRFYKEEKTWSANYYK